MRYPHALSCALLLGALLASGCNVLEPFYGDAESVLDLTEDARHARAAGDYVRAVALLEKALEKEPANPTVRVELSSTLMRRDRLTLLDLEKLTAHLFGALDGHAHAASPALARAPLEGDVCTFGPEASAEPFDPRSPDYDRIVAARPTIRRVLDLLSDPEAPTETPALPPALTELDVCSVLVDDGVHYDRHAVLAAVRKRFETPEQVTAALTMNALALSLTAYVSLFEQPDLPVRWFAVDGAEVGACVAEGHYDLLVTRARAEVQRVGQALLSLDLLETHTNHAESAALVDKALELYQSVRGAELDPCSGTD